MHLRHAPLLLAAALTGSTGQADDAAVPFAWRAYDLPFVHQGFTSHYSCDAAAAKVRTFLQSIGAADVVVQPDGCVPTEIAPLVRLRLTFRAPAPVERGGRADGVARWRTRRFDSGGVLTFPEAGDCELVESLRDRVVRKLPVRGVVDRVRCVPHQLAGSNVDLRFDALEPVAR